MPAYKGHAEIWSGDTKVADVPVSISEGRTSRKTRVSGRVTKVACVRTWKTYLDDPVDTQLISALDAPDLSIVVNGRRHPAFHSFTSETAAEKWSMAGLKLKTGHRIWGVGLGPLAP